jgi:hypothetical protein
LPRGSCWASCLPWATPPINAEIVNSALRGRRSKQKGWGSHCARVRRACRPPSEVAAGAPGAGPTRGRAHPAPKGRAWARTRRRATASGCRAPRRPSVAPRQARRWGSLRQGWRQAARR